MAESLGKKWEAFFKQNWKECFPNTFIYRLPDQLRGYAGAGGSNPCDFICLPKNSILLMLELKEHKGNTINWTAIRQYEKLLAYKDLENVYPGILIWFSDHDKIIFCPIGEAEKMHKDGLKSINIKLIESNKYLLYNIPATKKRVFLNADFNTFVEELEKNDK